MTVPDVITRYVTSAAEGDLDTLVDCFTDDAVVEDDGHTYRGHAEILAWREDLIKGPAYTATVLRSSVAGPSSYAVTTFVEGNFPGSPVELQYAFTTSGGLISKLTIAP